MWTLRSALILSILLLPIGNLEADTFPVTKTADTNDGTCDPDCSLREAIGAANAHAGSSGFVLPLPKMVIILSVIRILPNVY